MDSNTSAYERNQAIMEAKQKEQGHIKRCEEQMDRRNEEYLEGVGGVVYAKAGSVQKHVQERTAIVALELLKMLNGEAQSGLRGGGAIVEVAGKIVYALDAFAEREKLRRNTEKDTL